MNSVRHNWATAEVSQLFQLPFNDLVFQAQVVHRQNFDPNEVQMSTLLSIKTGACPEDCSYCPQSGHFATEVEKEKLMSIERVVDNAKAAKAKGASRFCMGAAWRSIPKKDLPNVVNMVKEVKALGLEACMTLGMLSEDQAVALKEAGLDYYNHNIDTSPEYYEKIISTRCFQDRLDTIAHVRKAGINVCCGGIVGLGESLADRVEFLRALANLDQHPESVPINRLVTVAGTPLEKQAPIEDIDFVRTIAVARIMMPKSMVRLSAGRETMSASTQALCFLAGANSIFYGEKLLTTPNPEQDRDIAMMKKLGIKSMGVEAEAKTESSIVG